MANPKHLAILEQGWEAWGDWRKKNPTEVLDLSGAELSLAALNFWDLSYTDFSGANLAMADIKNARLTNARFVGTSFFEADLSSSDLTDANLTAADLTDANLRWTTLKGVNLDRAVVCGTTFVRTDLSETRGLETVKHLGPSSIGIDTLYLSKGKIPDKFLREAGVSEDAIEHLLPLIRAGSPIQFYSCFISYSTKDEAFAQRLHSRMREAGLRVWFAPEDMKGGDYFFEQIERAIQLHDRLLLVLSEDSIQSKWVEREIRNARKVERAEKRRKLFPITLTDYETLKKWECLDSDTGEDLAEEVRKYHIPDFSNWKNDDAFEHAFARLEKDLRASISK
jgi:uncharacterized protein YjbI with pentapeptide repeats